MRYAKGLTSFGIEGGFLPRSQGHNPFLVRPTKGLLTVDLSGDRDPPDRNGLWQQWLLRPGVRLLLEPAGGQCALGVHPEQLRILDDKHALITDAEVGIADIGKIAPFQLEL